MNTSFYIAPGKEFNPRFSKTRSRLMENRIKDGKPKREFKPGAKENGSIRIRTRKAKTKRLSLLGLQ